VMRCDTVAYGSRQRFRQYLLHHASAEWGDLNERSLRHCWRVLSSYLVGDTVIWIITAADRSVTTILLTEDY
jgi:predicted PurR-regulated permease PerM